MATAAPMTEVTGDAQGFDAEGSDTEGSDTATFIVVGINADGWSGLSARARDELSRATVVFGSRRQLGLLQEIDGETVAWESPMSTHLASVLDRPPHPVVHILASGDPMFHGVGASIITAVGAQRVQVIPAVSSVSLAGARLGWDLTETRVISAVTADAHAVIGELTDGACILVLSRDQHTPATVADILTERGFGWSTLTVLEQLGGPAEQITGGLARSWAREAQTIDPLNIVAISCVGPHRSRVPGLPDTEYRHDGQITKSPFRALTVSALRPGGRQVLWDIGSGSGSIAIEWLRADDRGIAICFELDADRSHRITDNAHRHGVCSALSVRGPAPDALRSAPDPDVVFIGGGRDEAVLGLAWGALLPGGRLVANAVTVETQTILTGWHARLGGVLRRVSIETAEPLGSMTAWRPALPIVQWVVDKP